MFAHARLTALAGYLIATAPASTEDLALVLTAENYDNAGHLVNPANDGDLFQDQLQGLGFSVIVFGDLDLARMRRALEYLADEVETADRVLVFFAGHGVQMGGRSRLLPTDADLRSSESLAASSVPLVEFATLAGKARKVGMVFFDACRNDPSLQSSVEGGRSVRLLLDGTKVEAGLDRPVDEELASVGREMKGGGTYILGLSTSMGQVATDGTGLNSPFTAALVDALSGDSGADGLPQRVTEQVLYETHGRQRPVFRVWQGQKTEH